MLGLKKRVKLQNDQNVEYCNIGKINYLWTNKAKKISVQNLIFAEVYVFKNKQQTLSWIVYNGRNRHTVLNVTYFVIVLASEWNPFA